MTGIFEKVRTQLLTWYWTARFWWWFRSHSAGDFEDALIGLGYKVVYSTGDRNEYTRVYRNGDAAFTINVKDKRHERAAD